MAESAGLAKIWLTPQKMLRLRVKEGTDLNPEGQAWWGLSKDKAGKGRGEKASRGTGLEVRVQGQPSSKAEQLSSTFHSHHAIYYPNLDASESESRNYSRTREGK